MTSSNDPFSCFGEELEPQEDRDEGAASITNSSKKDDSGRRLGITDPIDHRPSVPGRDPLCGVLTYHRGTERSLLVFVENEVKKLDQRECSSLAQDVLEAVDKYSLERHWMMHCGPRKGKVIRDFLQDCVASRIEQSHEHHPVDPDARLIVVELGTYCGYGSILLAKALREDLEILSPLDFHIFTVEANAECVAVATRLIELAGMNESITVILNEDLTPTSNELIKSLQWKIRERFHNPENFAIDFIFMDHDKEQYLLDLQALEGSRLIRKGTFVAADNVIFAHIDDYRDYLDCLEQKEIVRNNIVELELEYSEPDLLDDKSQEDVRDGIEFTVYLEDPVRDGDS